MKTFSDTAQNDMERTMNTLTMMMMIVVILMLCFPYGNFPIHQKFCRCEYCCICHFLQNCLVLTLCISQNCKVYLSKLPNVFVQELCGDYIMSPKFVSRSALPRTLRTSCLLSEEILQIRSYFIRETEKKRKYIFYGEKEIQGLSRGEIQNKRKQTCLGQMSPKFGSDVTF